MSVWADEFGDLVRRFASLIRNGTGSAAGDERQLAVLCDRLGLSAHLYRDLARAGDFGEIPERDYAHIRRLVSMRFPRLGYYNTVAGMTVGIGAGEVVVGDAIDDLTDVADELAAVEWCLDNTGEPDALWHFFDGYDHHWGEHLRRLQLYLYCLDREL